MSLSPEDQHYTAIRELRSWLEERCTDAYTHANHTGIGGDRMIQLGREVTFFAAWHAIPPMWPGQYLKMDFFEIKSLLLNGQAIHIAVGGDFFLEGVQSAQNEIKSYLTALEI